MQYGTFHLKSEKRKPPSRSPQQRFSPSVVFHPNWMKYNCLFPFIESQLVLLLALPYGANDGGKGSLSICLFLRGWRLIFFSFCSKSLCGPAGSEKKKRQRDRRKLKGSQRLGDAGGCQVSQIGGRLWRTEAQATASVVAAASQLNMKAVCHISQSLLHEPQLALSSLEKVR